MLADALQTRIRVYRLMESAQADDHGSVRAELVGLEAAALARGWSGEALLAAAGVVLHDIVRGDDADALAAAALDLRRRAELLGDPPLLAVALALGAVVAAGADDGASLLALAGRAVALVESEQAEPLERCFVWVVCAAAYNTLNLWELIDDLYARASAAAPDCPVAVQQPAVEVNRIILHLEWAAALLELGEDRDALPHLSRAALAARTALSTDDVPPLWTRDVRAMRDLVGFAARALAPGAEPWPGLDADLAGLAAHRSVLERGEDVDALPMLEAYVALALARLGRPDLATGWVGEVGEVAVSASSGSTSFVAWVRAEIAAHGRTDPALAASRAYGATVSRLRWTSRHGVLEAARSKIADERLSAEHAVLSRDVLLDPLTGLSNRRCFDDWLARPSAEERPAAVLLIDVDLFKHVNDEHGHATGDEVLRRVARLVAHHVRPDDLALRLGGDEFAVVLTGGGDLDAVRRTARGRADAIREAVAAADWEGLAPGLRLRVSIGVATATVGPRRPGAADALYRAADADLYGAKTVRDLAGPHP